MGNCQAAEAATVVIQHPEGKVERVYWSLSASQVMAANPGHYVAVITTTTTPLSVSSAPSSYHSYRRIRSSSGTSASSDAPVKHLKLLRPDDTLHIGHVYRLVSFEEVLREFASKKHVKLSRLLVKQKDQKTRSRRGNDGSGATTTSSSSRHRGGDRYGSRVAEAEKSQAAAATTEEQQQQQRQEELEAKLDTELDEVVQRMMMVSTSRPRGIGGGALVQRHGQWRPALHSISEGC